jgi:hypothetical protein
MNVQCKHLKDKVLFTSLLLLYVATREMVDFTVWEAAETKNSMSRGDGSRIPQAMKLFKQRIAVPSPMLGTQQDHHSFQRVTSLHH